MGDAMLMRGTHATGATRPAVRHHRSKPNGGIQILSDPTGDYEEDTMFGLSDFCFGLSNNNWPDGMTFKKGGAIYTISGGRVVNEAGEVVDVRRYWDHTTGKR